MPDEHEQSFKVGGVQVTTFENRPATETPDWVAQAGNRCAGCDASANLCHCLAALPGDLGCCSACTHPATMPEPKVWNGSD